MTFVAPLFLATLALAIPVLITFLVKRQRRILRVPSTMVWRLSARSVAKNRRFRDLRRLFALLACLGAIAALGVAAARPSGSRDGATIYVVDVSASMSGEPLTDARRWLVREVAALGPHARVAIIAAGERPRVHLPPTAPGPLLDDAIASLREQKESASIESAVVLAESLAADGARVVILTDHPLPAETSGRATARVFRRRATENLGVVSLVTRTAPDAHDDDEREATIGIASSGKAPRTAHLLVTLGTKVLADRTVTVAPGSTALEHVTVRGGGRLKARVEPADRKADAIAIDDEAVVEEHQRKAPRVALVADEARSASAFFVERALRAAGVTRIEQVVPAAKAPAADLAVVLKDGPARPREVPALFFGDAPAELGFEAKHGDGSLPKLRSVASEEPLLRGVSLDDVTILRARTAATTPRGARVLVELDGGPTLLAGGTDHASWVWLGVDPDASDLVLRVAFPVLVGNVLAHLGGGAQVVSAETSPRAETALDEPVVSAPMPAAAEPRWRVPSGPPVLLAGFGAMLLALEAWFSLRRRRVPGAVS